MKTIYYVAVCVDVRGERVGMVVHADTLSKAVRFAETIPNRIGYVGGDSFDMAVKRAGMMERNEPGAWGHLPESLGN